MFGLRRRQDQSAEVIDCFTFYNELDLLDVRLRYLSETVDRFVLVESPLTHSGKPKPLYFSEAADRFAWAADKIEHVVQPLDPDADAWSRENAQRNAIAAALRDVPSNATVMISDLDEIPSRDAVARCRGRRGSFSLRQLLHYYYVDCRCRNRKRRNWLGTVIAPNETVLVQSPQVMREKSMAGRLTRVGDGGWHFSYLGGVPSIQSKLAAFAHTEFDKSEYSSATTIRARLEAGEDVFGRSDMRFEIVSRRSLPHELLVLLEKYPHFFAA